MALYKVRTKRRKCCNGISIEPGMEVQVVTPLNNTVQVNNWQYVEDAFQRIFGLSLRYLFRTIPVQHSGDTRSLFCE